MVEGVNHQEDSDAESVVAALPEGTPDGETERLHLQARKFQRTCLFVVLLNSFLVVFFFWFAEPAPSAECQQLLQQVRIEATTSALKQYAELGCDPTLGFTMKRVPLVLASQHGHVNIVRQMIDSLAGQDDIALLVRKIQGRATKIQATKNAALHAASAKGHHGIVAMLLTAGAAVEDNEVQTLTPIWMATQNGHRDTVRLLLKHHADICQKTGSGDTLLHAATWKGDIAMARILLRSGARPDMVNDSGVSPFYYAAEHGNMRLVKLFLKSKGGVDAVLTSRYHPCHLCTPLHVAIRRKDLRMASLILKAVERGIETGYTDPPDTDGWTALHEASGSGYINLVKQLLRAKGPVDPLGGADNVTPLFLATQNGYKRVVEILLDEGADPNAARGRDSFMPLLSAIKNKHPAIARLLIKRGAKMIRPTQSNEEKSGWYSRRARMMLYCIFICVLSLAVYKAQ